ncbi:MAG: T9SS type A sorting domain-containing protein, partial [Bacteroidales bacterium]|nr:T9SS type A sorting domain-containing protein [Bacteroidales bacterium]
GKSATSTGLVLATDTIHYHISESAFAAPEMVTGVEDATVTEGRLWPNPARNTLYVQLPSDSQCETVVVTDAAGRTVCRIDRPADGGSETTLNVSGWAEGVYFLHAGTTTLKFVVAR